MRAQTVDEATVYETPVSKENDTLTLTDLDKRSLFYDRRQLDLTKVMEYARAEYRWDAATTARAEKGYRDFLLVSWTWSQSQYRDTQVAAISSLADQVWHRHLLLPIDYRDACALIFGAGRLLNHEPELGENREDKPGEWDLVAWAYGKAGLTTPTDLHQACVWPKVG